MCNSDVTTGPRTGVLGERSPPLFVWSLKFNVFQTLRKWFMLTDRQKIFKLYNFL